MYEYVPPCVCVCVFVQVHLIYLTDLYPSQKATGVRNSVISAVWQCSVCCMSVIASENEKYQQILYCYTSICQHLLLWGIGFVNEWRFYERCLSLPVCIFYQTSLRSGGCPCLCQTSVSEQSVLTGSQRCLIARCLFPVQKGNWMAFLLCVIQA